MWGLYIELRYDLRPKVYGGGGIKIFYTMYKKKRCRSCGKLRRITAFSKRSDRPRARRPECKKCASDRIKLNLCKKHSTDDYSKARRCERYGLTLEELEIELLKTHCEICSKPIPKGKKNFDHNHTTGEFRGVLCVKCNTGLGLFQDNTGVLKEAIKYLEERGSYLDAPEDIDFDYNQWKEDNS